MNGIRSTEYGRPAGRVGPFVFPHAVAAPSGYLYSAPCTTNSELRTKNHQLHLMPLGINDVKDLLEVISFVATVIGGIAILFAVRDYSTNRKQLNLSALESCITRFRDNFIHLNYQSPEPLVVEYIDLVNEELFYFQNRYLPKAVAREWIDGMIDAIPLYDPVGNVLNQGYCIPLIHQRRLLDQYRFRRVRRAFTICQLLELEVMYGDGAPERRELARRKVVDEIIGNLYRMRQ